MNRNQIVHVAVGVLLNAEDEVLVALRPRDVHQGGLWEFPGGKVESNESVEQALRREFEEEVGLTIGDCTPLLQIRHDYADKSVLLDVWSIGSFGGSPSGLEGQEIAWRKIADLDPTDFPEANAGIIRTLRLPRRIAITAEAFNRSEMQEAMQHLLRQGSRLIYFRQKAVDADTYLEWFEWAEQLCGEHGATLMYSHPFELATLPERPAIGALHVTSGQLRTLDSRPIASTKLFSASCHTLEELRLAEALHADFAFLSPVNPTAKYPASKLLGWAGFERLARQVSLPLFALGGMQDSDLETSRRHRGFGIAGISAFTSS